MGQILWQALWGSIRLQKQTSWSYSEPRMSKVNIFLRYQEHCDSQIQPISTHSCWEYYSRSSAINTAISLPSSVTSIAQIRDCYTKGLPYSRWPVHALRTSQIHQIKTLVPWMCSLTCSFKTSTSHLTRRNESFLHRTKFMIPQPIKMQHPIFRNLFSSVQIRLSRHRPLLTSRIVRHLPRIHSAIWDLLSMAPFLVYA